MARYACYSGVHARAPVEMVPGKVWPKYEQGRVIVGKDWDPNDGWDWYVGPMVKDSANYNEACADVVAAVLRGEHLGTAVLDAIESHPNRLHARLLSEMLP